MFLGNGWLANLVFAPIRFRIKWRPFNKVGIALLKALPVNFLKNNINFVLILFKWKFVLKFLAIVAVSGEQFGLKPAQTFLFNSLKIVLD
jgi:hypothetical protein